MESKQQIELIINSNDEAIINDIKESLASLDVSQGKPARESGVITILVIVAETLKIVNELLKLKENLKKKQNSLDKPLEITIRNEDGDSIDLDDVTSEEFPSFLQSGNMDE
ncbi:hypothetical protein [Aulosira sp. FACHB-615]|uniref:hypothetical protein n=1 Tax=Aulosira sp. FACHB-615 TaxID=2692777 RepID=UPI0016843CEA|nr:hypothetical protein [Aulosira sp. FACHB-615]MBD2491974.1 hypothetical protein [Aulosira sp. FACHB-615]